MINLIYMKNLIFPFLLLFSFYSVNSYGQQLRGDSWQSVQAKGSGEVTVTYTYSGNFINTNNGQLDGLCIQIWKDFVQFVEDKHGVDLKVNFYKAKNQNDFSGFYNRVKNGDKGVFGLADVTITDARKQEVKFSPSFFSNVSILLTNKSVADLSSFSNISKDFAGKTIIIQKGTTHEQRAKALKASSFPSLKIETANSFEACYRKINKDSNYFTYLDFSSYLSAIEDVKNIKRHSEGDKTGENFGFIMPQNSDWRPVFVEYFNQNGGFTKSNQYKKMVANTLGTHVVSMLNTINK